MKKIIALKWRDLSPIWNNLYEKSTMATPFQSYEFLTYTGKGKPYRKDLFRLFRLKEWNLVLYDDEKAIAIAPLLIKKKSGRTMVYLRGHFTVANQLDFIYENLSYDDFKLIMEHIQNKLANASFYLDRVSEKTVTCQYLKEYFASKKIEEHECYSIPLALSYEDWLKNLSKSARQNLSNHYHRLERDNVNWSVSFYCNQKIERRLCKEMMGVYADRFLIKNHFCCGQCKHFVSRKLRQFLMCDKMTRWMNRTENNFHAVLTINSEVAAFASGIICKDKRILLSRLAILTKYSKYSPGGILISSTLKHLISQKNSGAMDIKELDLSQGGQDGMSYKKYYGGQVHYSYLFYE